MAMEIRKPTRRQFLIAGGAAAGGGLLLGLGLAASGPSRRERAADATGTKGGEAMVTTWL